MMCKKGLTVERFAKYTAMVEHECREYLKRWDDEGMCCLVRCPVCCLLLWMLCVDRAECGCYVWMLCVKSYPFGRIEQQHDRVADRLELAHSGGVSC